MKKILFTNLEMYNFAGSEIATMSLSSYFLSKGWEVSVFTLAFGEPLQSKLDKRIKIYTTENKEELSDYYDLIWAHHYPLLDYILFHLRIKAKHIYAESLSYFTVIEALPKYYKYLSVTGFVSQKSKDELVKKGFDTQNSFVLPNYATKGFFEAKHSLNKEVKNIAIVSNHVAPELEKFSEFCSDKKVNVDIYGVRHKFEFIDSNLLQKYDVVISIGKTIFYSLAMGIPSYSYDNGVSQGYINSQNFDMNFKANFAYRDIYKSKTPKELYDDIISNYNNTAKDQEKLIELSKNNFFFDDLLDDIYNKIMSCKPVDFEKLYHDFPTLPHTSRLYIEDRTNYCNLVKAQQEIIKSQQNLIEINQNALNDKDEEIDLIKNSTCWKLTSPLRRILSILKK